MDMVKNSFAGHHQVGFCMPRQSLCKCLNETVFVKVVYSKSPNGALNSGNVKRTDTV
jgi:hypothetical protein